jgi:cytochrome c5
LRSPTEFTNDNWETIMMHMRIQAGVSGQVARNIYAFLTGQGASTQEAPASTATPGKPGAVLPAGPNAKTNKPSGASANAPIGQSSKSGADIYRKTCITCHGGNGKGAVPGAPDFTSPSGPLKNSDATLQGRVINGYQSPGSPMAMPAKGGNSALTDADVKEVIKYIRATYSKG